MHLSDVLLQHPIQLVELGENTRVAYREAGKATKVTHVLLHGIGSASGSWALQLQCAQESPQVRVVAWDAPGYGESTPLAAEAPDASDYASRLWAWLDALDVRGPVTLVGHSLGALMVARAALHQAQRVHRLVLLSPARGYGNASEEERRHKLNDRLSQLERLGPEGMAQARGAAMLSPAAGAELVQAVRETMARIHVGGYTQAARLLSQGDLETDLRQVACQVQVASGSADTITPAMACQGVARAIGQDRIDLGPVGHACPLEAADAVNALTGLAPILPTE